jgi:hypothetical protein
VDLPTCGLRRGCVASIVVSEHRKDSFLSVEGKRRVYHATEKKGQENTQTTRGEGIAEKKR